ncbi:ATP-binding cassette sub-family G member 8-like [Teleopsis dalmanni]|uniref:ATP-binding cassette sub-family G member 8-like n=1 Tax=Teleopsis dalmanni TaxID=139649 RepID=UPI0018CD5721|nr:ATP-binding cassette sub-family G member 8-like [Teleopsis dalmanni]XP_037954748.1 ATP-binding cassette sub-family G member 8-like [Teleopsis dalmanni]
MELSNFTTSKKMSREERRYSVPHGPNTPLPPAASEDLHAWSIYRQNLNSDFTDSALGSSDKSPLPYGNFQLRDTTVQSILNHPRYGPKSPLGSNMYTYLKFGLPRVFPPNAGSQRSHRAGPGPGNARGRINRGFRDSSGGPAAGSSGYDSSDNETTRSRVPPNLRKYRSESDFRNIGGMPSSRPDSRAQGVPIAALRQANSRASIAVGTHANNHHYIPNGKHYGHRSHSEADLLSGGNDGISYDYGESRIYGTRHRTSDHPNGGHHSNYGITTRKQSSIGLVYPNIQVHCLDVNPCLRGVSLQAKAGDLFAIMATSQREGTALTECLAGLRERMGGEILINGQQINKRGLRELCSYVPALNVSSLDPRMSVQCTLNFHCALRGPLNRNDLEERMDVLIEDLGLTTVRASNVSSLTHSEKQRLSVACQLLAQSSILILDQVTSNMDIFDTFFLVEYLRQWCNGGRIVIMTLQPPTFEILSMCSGVLLLSGGRTVFSGSRSDLPRHMGELGYPCPPFKNPADYYLDLVTLDDLSAAAMLESSARIETLANNWDQINSEPPLAAPPASLTNFTRKAGVLGQTKALIKRFTSYKQPGSLLTWISKLIAAALLSLCIGCIFWDVPASDPQLTYNDRLGYHHCVIALAYWPLVMLTIRVAQEDRKHAERDIRLGLYSRTLYIIVQSILGLFPSLCIWLAYLLPAHSMAGLYTYSKTSDTGIYLYMGYMLLFLTLIQTLALFCAHLMPTKTSAIVFNALITLGLTAVGGYSVHPRNLSKLWSWSQLISPEKWLLPVLVQDEYSYDTLSNSGNLQLCRNKQVQHQEIIVQQTCPPPDGAAVLTDFLLLPNQHILDPTPTYDQTTTLALVLGSVILFVATFLVFVCNCSRTFRKKQKRI